MAAMLTVVLDGEGAWPDLAENGRISDRVIHIGNDSRMEVAGLAGGMTSGLPSVMFRIDLPDGRVVLAETSMRLFLTAARALQAKYGDQIGW